MLVLHEPSKLTQRLGTSVGSVLKRGLTAHDCLERFQLHRL